MARSNAPLCPETGRPMARGVRSISLTYRGETTSVPMPGWYAEGSAEGIHTVEDMAVSDRALADLKARVAKRSPARAFGRAEGE